jgi:hypothetical protein
MTAAILNLLPLLFKGLNTWLDWFFSSEQISARDTRRADNGLQDFDKALKSNDAAYVTGAALDLHQRVRNALRSR